MDIRSYIDSILQFIPYYGYFRISELTLPMYLCEYSDMQEAYKYLASNGYAIQRDDVKPDFEYMELTKRGRWLKQKGSFKAYHTYQSEKREKEKIAALEIVQRNKRDKYQFYINFCIAISTGLAAIYYLMELSKSFSVVLSIQFLTCLILLLLGAVGGIILYKLLHREK